MYILYIYIQISSREKRDWRVAVGSQSTVGQGRAPHATSWHLHDIVITNMARCIAYKREVGGGVLLSDNRAIVLHQGGQCKWAKGMK